MRTHEYTLRCTDSDPHAPHVTGIARNVTWRCPGITERCWSRGDGLHHYGQCMKSMGHDDEHEDEEGYVWT